MEMGRKTNTPRLGSYEKDWIDRFTTSVMRSFLLQPPLTIITMLHSVNAFRLQSER